jgi:hypothetical protein
VRRLASLLAAVAVLASGCRGGGVDRAEAVAAVRAAGFPDAVGRSQTEAVARVEEAVGEVPLRMVAPEDDYVTVHVPTRGGALFVIQFPTLAGAQETEDAYLAPEASFSRWVPTPPPPPPFADTQVTWHRVCNAFVVLFEPRPRPALERAVERIRDELVTACGD